MSEMPQAQAHYEDREFGSLPAFCRLLLAGIPGGTAVVFDQELVVQFAEGEALALAGLDALRGRPLPDALPGDLWRVLRAPYMAALHGEASSLDFELAGVLLSVQASPFWLAGGERAGLAVTREIGEQRRLESAVVVGQDAVLASEDLFRSTFEDAPSGIAVVGLDGRRLRVNKAYCRILGREPAELIGSSVGEFAVAQDAAANRQLFATEIAGANEGSAVERRVLRKDGTVVWVQTRSELVRNRAGAPLFVIRHLLDVSDRRAAEGQRRAGDRTLRAVLDNSPGVICVKDRDLRYQLVNRGFEDWYGITSDKISGRTSSELGISEARTEDQLVLDSGQTTQREETFQHDGRERVFLTMRFPLFDDRQSVQSVCTISTDITERRAEERAQHDRLQCSATVHAALTQRRFVLHGQPILNLASMQIEQAELLIRMQNEQGDGLIAPGEFLPAAERYGLIGLIDEWVLDRAVELAAQGHRVAVNLSAKTLSDSRQVARIERALLTSGAPAENLTFEITETAVAENLDAAKEFAVRLRGLGSAFALDDFGMGYGTFTYLKHLPVDYLKIDLAFVRDLLNGEANRDVVQAIISVAKQFSIKTIAEGVENQATLEQLRRLGVDYAQGYLIGRPVALDQLCTSTAIQ